MLLKSFILTTILALFVAVAPASAPAAHDPVTGEWNVVFSIQGQTADGVLKLKLEGNTVTGTVESAHTGPGTITNGSWKDGKLSFTMEFAAHESIAATGAPKEEKLQGEFATEGTTGTWVATRK